MSNIDGVYDLVAKTPMGEQKSVLTITSSGDTFTGTSAGPGGEVQIDNGTISGNELSWTMEIKQPFPMKLEGKATVDGDTLEGGLKAGAFGTHPVKGTKRA